MYTSIWLYITALMLQKLRWMTGDAKNVSVVCVQLFWVHYRYFFLCQGAGRVIIGGVGRTGFVNNPVQLSWSKEKKCCLFSHILWEIYCWKVLIKFFLVFLESVTLITRIISRLCLFSQMFWEMYCWKLLIKFFTVCFSRNRNTNYNEIMWVIYRLCVFYY